MFYGGSVWMCTGKAAVMHGSVESVGNSAGASYGPGGKLLLPILSMAPQLVGFIYKAKGLQASPFPGPFGKGQTRPTFATRFISQGGLGKCLCHKCHF